MTSRETPPPRHGGPTGQGRPSGGSGQEEGGLLRSMSLLHATAMVAGTIIGASIFVQPSEITGQVPTVGGMILVWVLSGALTLLGALVCAELASAFPDTGGVYVFLRKSFGPLLGFLWGWAMFWVMHTGIIAAIAMVFGRYLTYFFPAGDGGVRIAAVGAIAVLTWVNYLGVRHGSWLQTAFTVGKVGAIAVLVVVGGAILLVGGEGMAAAAPPASGPSAAGAWGLPELAGGLVAGLFAFGGWHMVTYTAGETHDAARTVPRALWIGVIVVTVCYVALNALYLWVLPLETVIASDRIAADAADVLFGTGGGALMSGLVVFSTFGALAGIVLTGPRVYYRMAHDGLLFRWLGQVHPEHRTPHRAVLLQGFWAVVLVLTGTYRELFTRVIYTEWIFFGLMAVGLVLLRGRKGYEPEYRIPAAPLAPLLFALASFLIVVNQVVSDPVESAVGLGFVLAGVPVYALTVRSSRSKGDQGA